MIIRIKKLRAKTIIGVFDWEKTTPREVVINLEMELDNEKATESDKLEDTLDYDTLSKKLVAAAAESKFELIEKLAKHLLDIVFEDKRIIRTRVELDKPGAVKEAKSVGIVLERKR